jgi:RimJ/RimL family protein N-acetyltransferase
MGETAKWEKPSAAMLARKRELLPDWPDEPVNFYQRSLLMDELTLLHEESFAQFLELRQVKFVCVLHVPGERGNDERRANIVALWEWMRAHQPQGEVGTIPEDGDVVEACPPEWTIENAVMHRLPEEWGDADYERLARETKPSAAYADVEVRRVESPEQVAHFPVMTGEWLNLMIASGTVWGVRRGGEVLAIAGADIETESLTELSVETLKEHRGHGLVGVASVALICDFWRRGKETLWVAHDQNAASLRAAAKLGYQPAAQVMAADAKAKSHHEG